MKRKLITLGTAILCIVALQGCSVSFSAGGMGKEKADATSNMVMAEPGGSVTIEMEDMKLTLPDGWKYGTQDNDMGRVHYVWNTDTEQISPADHDIILYIYEGNDINSPDKELTNQEARLSLQSYIQVFRETLNARVSADPDVTRNNGWYAFQFTAGITLQHLMVQCAIQNIITVYIHWSP